ncbi:MAG TPA: hypothetical protein VFY40_25185, partial [Blastocatellia bacterium]|nr:hypothetical protein [Blastocatellia bacterium]
MSFHLADILGKGVGRQRSGGSRGINHFAVIQILSRSHDIFDVRVIVLKEFFLDLPVSGFLTLRFNDFLNAIVAGDKEIRT